MEFCEDCSFFKEHINKLIQNWDSLSEREKLYKLMDLHSNILDKETSQLNLFEHHNNQ